jgi:hypothetical protein
MSNCNSSLPVARIVVKSRHPDLYPLAELDCRVSVQELTKHAQRFADVASFDLLTTDHDCKEITIQHVDRTVVGH